MVGGVRPPAPEAKRSPTAGHSSVTTLTPANVLQITRRTVSPAYVFLVQLFQAERQGIMNSFEIVTIAVTLIALALCLTRYFRTGRVVADLGRQGSMWFEHSEDRQVDDRPTEDAVDSPLPHRPLRTRY